MIRVKQVEQVRHIASDSSVLFIKFDFDKYYADKELLDSFESFVRRECKDIYSVLNCSNFSLAIELDEVTDFAILDFMAYFMMWYMSKGIKGIKLQERKSENEH